MYLSIEDDSTTSSFILVHPKLIAFTLLGFCIVYAALQ